MHPSQEARLLASLDHERTWREMLQAKLTTAEADNRQAREQLAQARLESQRDHQASTRNAKICTALQERLLELEATLRQDAQQRAADAAALRQLEQQRAADAAAGADRLTKRHAEFTAGLAQAARLRDTLAQQLNEVRVALEEARKSREVAARQVDSLRAVLEETEARHTAERAADAERRAAHDAEVAADIARISDERDAVRAQLTAAATALDASHAQRAREESAARATLEQTVEVAARAKREAEVRHALEQATATSRRNALQRQFDEAVSQAAAAREALEQQLSDASAAIERAKEDRAEVAASLAQMSYERDELTRRLTATAADLERTMHTAAREQREAEERHRVQLAAAASTRDALQQQFDDAVAEATAAREILEAQLSAKVSELEASQAQRAREEAAARATLAQTVETAARVQRDTEDRHTRELATLTAHRDALQKQFDETLVQAAATRAGFDRQLREAAAALERAEARSTADAIAAAESVAQLEAQLADLRATFERELRETRAESAHVRRRVLAAASALRRRTADNRARLEDRVAGERASYDRRLEAQTQEIRQVGLERDALNASLGTVRAELQSLRDTYEEARNDFEQVRAKNAADLQQLSAEYDQTRQSLDHLRDAFNTLERVSSEHAFERARLEGVVADRDAQLRALESTHAAAELAGQEALRRTEETLRHSVDTRDRKLATLEHDLDLLRRELERMKVDRETLRKEADQLPGLRGQLNASQRESWLQFEQAPYAMWRVTRDGALVSGNQALARILGYRSSEDLAKLNFSTAVFEAPPDLRWVIDRAVGGGSIEPVETVWKKKDRTRLTVRLRVVRTKDDWIEVSAEDVTQLRATEEDLRHARRMEAVGRLASEVAVTCDTLLRGVSHGGQHWLAAMGSDLGLRHQGERLLGEVAHATSLLQRLAAYGNEQIDALEPVNLQHVLRNLEPVLARVAGDDIEVVLPKKIPPFLVDVERSRVERVLVNVASYARERIPHGGRLRIDLSSAVVDRTFLDKYPNVRPGRHVIATVTEERGARVAAPAVLRSARSDDDHAAATPDKPGVDLSALVQLLAGCGGHLWVAAEPPGNMTLKIHLPLHASDSTTSPIPPLATSHRGKPRGRWFRH